MMVNLPCLMVSRTNFLRPTCSYTEFPLSFLTGSCPMGKTTASYCSCLYFDFTDLSIPQDTDIPWTLTMPRLAGLCDDVVTVTLHRFRVSFLLFRSSDVCQHLLRIIDRAILQNRVDDPQKLAGYHNQ